MAQQTPERAIWERRVPETVRLLERHWSITLGTPFEHDGCCSWVAPARCSDGTAAVLKLGWPHFEAKHEISGLRFWNGDPTVRLLEAEDELGAMLLEQCIPATSLRTLPEPEQDVVVARLLRRLWRVPVEPHPFRPLSEMLDFWAEETLASIDKRTDRGLVAEGLRLCKELPGTADTEVLLATDLHAGNILRSEREPWLVIDPKPFLGDPAYDATQHIFNCRSRLLADPLGMIRRMSDLLQLDSERVRLWMFARAAAWPNGGGQIFAIARALA